MTRQPVKQGKPCPHCQPENTGLSVWPALRYGRHMLITFTNTKGGVGKSTLACHLAIWLHDKGFRVAMLDTDEQQSSARWIQAAEPGITLVVAHKIDEIRKARTTLLETHDVVVADSPGSSGDASHSVTLLADLAIVPLQPSKLDVWGVADALKFVRLAQEMGGSRKPEAAIVLTFTAKGDVQTKELRRQLQSLELGATIARSEIRRLNAFRDACGSAVTRKRDPRSQDAAGDIDALFMELLADKLFRSKAANE